MTRSVTIRDVAEDVGVSPATVSNAMNRPGRVSSATRESVLAAVDRLGYVPPGITQHRSRTQRLRVGVIGPFSTYASYSERLRGVLEGVVADRTEVLVFDHPSASRTPSPRLATMPLSGDLDGLIIMGVPVDEQLRARLVERRLPTVLIDIGHPQFTSVVLDEAHGTRLAAEHLISRDYERFVYVTEGQLSREYISQGQRRWSGFQRALTDRGVKESHIQRITARSGDARAGHAAAEVILSSASKHRVGVLAGHDVLAAGVMAGLDAAGAAVPETVGVVGWDGGDVVEALGLTTVRQPLVESGRLGIQRLTELMPDSEAPIERIQLYPVLRVGAST